MIDKIIEDSEISKLETLYNKVSTDKEIDEIIAKNENVEVNE